MSNYKKTSIIILLIMILSLPACDSKENPPLLGKWVSEKNVFAYLNRDYKETRLEFTHDRMKINEKWIPVVYKIKKDQVVLFSRGDKVTAFFKADDKFVLFLPNIGKRMYIRSE